MLQLFCISIWFNYYHTFSKKKKNLNFNFLQAAREAKALEAAKKDLEKQVEELTMSLQTEKRTRVIYLFIY